MKATENTERDPDDPEPAGEGDTQIEYSNDQLYSASNKKLPVKPRSV
jgi:hypothetical protein